MLSKSISGIPARVLPACASNKSKRHTRIKMNLKSRDGREFRLTILGYQFPDITNQYEDSNWLNIRIQVKDRRGPWETSGPWLRTEDVAELATWLDAVAVEAPMINRETLRETGRSLPPGFPNLRLYDSMEFLEPNLRFAFVEKASDFAILRIYFELEARPPWAAASAAGMEDLWIDLHVSPEAVKAAAQSLRSDLSVFPIRAMG